jgi:hypothetical protein
LVVYPLPLHWLHSTRPLPPHTLQALLFDTRPTKSRLGRAPSSASRLISVFPAARLARQQQQQQQ